MWEKWVPSPVGRIPWRRTCCCLAAKSCSTLWDHLDCSPPGSPVHGVSQAGVQGELPLPSPGGLPDPGIGPVSPALAGRFFNHWATWEAHNYGYHLGNEGKSGIEVGIKRNFKFTWSVLFLEKNEIVWKILNSGQFWIVKKTVIKLFSELFKSLIKKFIIFSQIKEEVKNKQLSVLKSVRHESSHTWVIMSKSHSELEIEPEYFRGNP